MRVVRPSASNEKMFDDNGELNASAVMSKTLAYKEEGTKVLQLYLHVGVKWVINNNSHSWPKRLIWAGLLDSF